MLSRAWVECSSPPKYSNLVWGITLRYPGSGMILELNGHKVIGYADDNIIMVNKDFHKCIVHTNV